MTDSYNITYEISEKHNEIEFFISMCDIFTTLKSCVFKGKFSLLV